MIELIEAKEMRDLWIKIDEINERTKRHTKQIQELTRMIKAK